MNPIRCPECGLTNYPDDVTYPLCGQCREDLVRCDSCRHYEAGVCSHPRSASRYQPDEQAAKRCPDFSSRHQIRHSRLVANLPAAFWVSMLLFLLLASSLALAWFVDPLGRYFNGNPLLLNVRTIVPDRVTTGTPFTITLQVTNPLDRPSSHVYIEIEKEFLANVDWSVPSPEPERIIENRNQLILQYPPLMPSHLQTLQLPFIARKEGIAPFIAKVYAPSNQLRYKVYAPITVSGDQSASRADTRLLALGEEKGYSNGSGR